MANNIEMIKIASKYLGKGGATFTDWAGLRRGSAYCQAFVCYVANEGGVRSLFYGGKKVTYCPNGIAWCYNNLAQIPLYLALPGDIIYFDWEPNGMPNHVGFVLERDSATTIRTIEGNTSGGIVATKTRAMYGKKNGKTVQYIQGVFRPHYAPTAYSKTKALTVDGYFGYNSISMLQKALGVKQDAILGQNTIKALQKLLGLDQDGLWGPKTTKAMQKVLGVKQDGYFGPDSVKALQKWINKRNGSVSEDTLLDKELNACKVQAEWMKNYVYGWESHPTIAKSKKKGTCVTYVACVLQRIGYLKSGECIWHDEKGNVDVPNDKMKVYHPNGTIKAVKDKFKAGDIVIAGDKASVKAGGNSHIFVLTGKWDKNDNPYIWDNNSATRVKNGKSGVHTYSGSNKVIALIRLK